MSVLADAPVAAWLHRGPNSQATVTISVIGSKHRPLSLTRVQVTELRRRLVEAEALLARDDGDLMFRKSHKLEGFEA
jgi:hypothetical protein